MADRRIEKLNVLARELGEALGAPERFVVHVDRQHQRRSPRGVLLPAQTFYRVVDRANTDAADRGFVVVLPAEYPNVVMRREAMFVGVMLAKVAQ